jgi:hypothetical protein
MEMTARLQDYVFYYMMEIVQTRQCLVSTAFFPLPNTEY